MNYTENKSSDHGVSAQCQSCGYGGDERSMGKCERCGAVYHPECFNQTGSCKGYGCGCESIIPLHKKGFEQPLETLQKESSAAERAGIRIGHRTKGALREELEYERIDAAEYDLPASQELREKVTASAPLGSAFTGKYNRLDIDTPFEQLFSGGAFLVLVLGTLAAFSQQGFMGIDSANPSEIPGFDRGMLIDVGFISLALIAVKFFSDFTYVIDNEHRQLLYSRSILGFTWTWKICSFDDVVAVGADAFYRIGRKWTRGLLDGITKHYYFGVTIGLSSGHAIRVSPYFGSKAEAQPLGISLAHHFGVEYQKPCVDAGSLAVHEAGLPMKQMDVAWRQPTLTGEPGAFDYIVLVASILTIVGASIV